MLKALIFSMIVSIHPVHVSLMSADYSEKSNAFKVFLKIYSDDFLIDYKLLTGEIAEIDLINNPDQTKAIILKYLNAKIEIFAEDVKLAGKLINIDISDGELRIDLEYINIKKTKKYLVKNLIMTDLYTDQANMLIFKYRDFEEGIKLTPQKKEQVFNVE